MYRRNGRNFLLDSWLASSASYENCSDLALMPGFKGQKASTLLLLAESASSDSSSCHAVR